MLRSVRGYDRNTEVLYAARGNESHTSRQARQVDYPTVPPTSYATPMPHSQAIPMLQPQQAAHMFQPQSYVNNIPILPQNPYMVPYVPGSGCDYHKNTTHVSADCYTLKRKREDEEDVANGVECFHCHQIGHRRFNCPSRRAQRRSGIPETASRRSPSSSQGSSIIRNNGQQASPPQQYFNGQPVPPFDYAKYNEWLASQQIPQVNFTETSKSSTATNNAPKRPKLASRSPSDSGTSSASDLSKH
ncbi:hypothetical protein EDC01DRAFT_630305 [Geopyxis carbonaria]|nr:hypothetical protein EDC01DRAFT_630305 [Geopyxis carbonaria]